jgi:hypothetical protein
MNQKVDNEFSSSAKETSITMQVAIRHFRCIRLYVCLVLVVSEDDHAVMISLPGRWYYFRNIAFSGRLTRSSAGDARELIKSIFTIASPSNSDTSRYVIIRKSVSSTDAGSYKRHTGVSFERRSID